MMIYLKDDVATKLKDFAQNDKRTVSATVEVMLEAKNVDFLLQKYPKDREVALDLIDRGFSVGMIDRQFEKEKRA